MTRKCLDSRRRSRSFEARVDAWFRPTAYSGTFHVGGYQVCDKWLKDRRGRPLTTPEVETFRRVVATLRRTIELMGRIDSVINGRGGWSDSFRGSPEGTLAAGGDA